MGNFYKILGYDKDPDDTTKLIPKDEWIKKHNTSSYIIPNVIYNAACGFVSDVDLNKWGSKIVTIDIGVHGGPDTLCSDNAISALCLAFQFNKMLFVSFDDTNNVCNLKVIYD